MTPITIYLDIGYTDRSGRVHGKVVFGRRLTGRDLFRAEDDPQSRIPTQYNDLLLRAAIIEFGELSMPVPLTALLELDSIDRDDLHNAFNRFQGEAPRAVEHGTERTVLLPFGYARNGIVYDLIEFGRRLTGMDEVEADRLGLQGVRRQCFLVGRQAVRLAQSEGASELPGPIPLDVFEELDVVDIHAAKAGAELFRSSFRRDRTRVPAERNGQKRGDSGDEAALDGERHSKSAL